VVLARGQSEVGPVGVVVPSSWDMARHGLLEFFGVSHFYLREGKEGHAWRAGVVVPMGWHRRAWHCAGRSSRGTIWWWGGRRVSAGRCHVVGTSCDANEILPSDIHVLFHLRGTPGMLGGTPYIPATRRRSELSSVRRTESTYAQVACDADMTLDAYKDQA
jgi:hypothetical protein